MNANHQSSGEFSKQALLDFLDYVGEKGLLKRGTVAARKAAVNTILDILSEDEASDLRDLDLDEVLRRFGNLKGTEFKPASLRMYRVRIANSLKDLKKYREDPIRFKPNITLRTLRKKRSASIRETSQDRLYFTETPIPDRETEIAFPVPIRPGRVVRIVGVPSDLSKSEARKIANVVLALAENSDE